ncbi:MULTISPECIES: GDP-L-fucose synthase family protein [Prochlorococcus]|uniref:GDP-L-fucose synthase family protein n=1 Tax=Prochlorococcus TaxID=1218 RepID=UPI0005339632|nr:MULTISPECIES: GDP-L-fucose synthase [Prochlorococcus]KGG12109.1 GDP-L-fucose synthetase [Prochlorococcus sp. MIT 0601]
METSSNQRLIHLEDRIFVAGHRGMAGRAIVKSLKQDNYKYILTAERHELDLCEKKDVQNWFKAYKPSVVILAAGRVGGIKANSKYPYEFLIENISIQNSVINTAWKEGVRRLLFLGSSCIYPKYSEQPIQEEALLSGILEPSNEWYSIAKITGIKLCEALRRQYNFDAITLIPPNLYGPGDKFDLENGHVMGAMIRKFSEGFNNDLKKVACWGSGSPKREFLHVSDLASACKFALEYWNPSDKSSPTTSDGSKLYYLNVGSGEELTIQELACLIAKSTGYKGEIDWDRSKPDGTPRKILDSSRFQKLGWKPTISLEEGIKTCCLSYD